MRIKNYSLYTERTYCQWGKQFIKFHQLNERTALFENSEAKIEAFLNYLVTERTVVSITQNQAMNALVFLYKQALDIPLTERIRSKTSRHVPVVLSLDEVRQVLPRICCNTALIFVPFRRYWGIVIWKQR